MNPNRVAILWAHLSLVGIGVTGVAATNRHGPSVSPSAAETNAASYHYNDGSSRLSALGGSEVFSGLLRPSMLKRVPRSSWSPFKRFDFNISHNPFFVNKLCWIELTGLNSTDYVKWFINYEYHPWLDYYQGIQIQPGTDPYFIFRYEVYPNDQSSQLLESTNWIVIPVVAPGPEDSCG